MTKDDYVTIVDKQGKQKRVLAPKTAIMLNVLQDGERLRVSFFDCMAARSKFPDARSQLQILICASPMPVILHLVCIVLASVWQLATRCTMLSALSQMPTALTTRSVKVRGSIQMQIPVSVPRTMGALPNTSAGSRFGQQREGDLCMVEEDLTTSSPVGCVVIPPRGL